MKFYGVAIGDVADGVRLGCVTYGGDEQANAKENVASYLHAKVRNDSFYGGAQVLSL